MRGMRVRTRTSCVPAAWAVISAFSTQDASQDAGLRNRGIGIHARQVLAALKGTVKPAGKIVFLLDPTMDSVDAGLRPLFDEQVYSCANIDLSRVKLFVSASPMTASIGPVMPLLVAPHIRRVAVVYDFIPAEFPSSYLRSAVDRICYQARYMALPTYHAFLPISAATEVKLHADCNSSLLFDRQFRGRRSIA